MNPNAELCRRYGTKTAESPLEVLVGLMGTGALIADQRHVAHELQRAERQSEIQRAAEADRMRSTRRGLRPQGGMAPDFTDYPGVGSLRDMEPGLPMALSFEKGGEVAETARELVKAAVTGPGLAKALGGGLRAAAGGVAAGAGHLGQGIGQAAQRAGQAIREAGPTGRLISAAGPTLMQGVDPGPAHRVGQLLERAGAAAQQGGQGLAARGSEVAGSGARAARAGLADKAAPAAAPLFGPSKPLLGFGTKAKLLGAGGVLAAGYTGAKALGAVRDYMDVPAGYHHSGYVRGDLTDYGY